QCAKDEPESPAGGDHIAGVPPAPLAMPHTGCCFPPLPLLGEYHAQATVLVSTGAGGSHSSQAVSALLTDCHTTVKQERAEQKAAEEASDASLHGSSVAGLLQSIQQLLVQILQTSRQQQALLESLASDTVSHLHLLSHSLVQVGETLHQLLLRPQAHPGPLSHCVPHMPLFDGGPGVPCSDGTPRTSLDHKEELQVSPAASCTPP
ncbi:hypothetical protein N330_06642, partial [Leptosomus discolor]